MKQINRSFVRLLYSEGTKAKCQAIFGNIFPALTLILLMMKNEKSLNYMFINKIYTFCHIYFIMNPFLILVIKVCHVCLSLSYVIFEIEFRMYMCAF